MKRWRSSAGWLRQWRWRRHEHGYAGHVDGPRRFRPGVTVYNLEVDAVEVPSHVDEPKVKKAKRKGRGRPSTFAAGSSAI